MVGRSLKTRSRSESPCLTVRAEKDNTFLSVKNDKFTQTVVKLKKKNADLTKQLSLCQGEVFDLRARCNNLKNIISNIHSNVETTFPGIVQLCSVAAHLCDLTTVTPTAKASVDLRTQAVNPPCPDRAPDIAMPSTSRTPSQSNGNRHRIIMRGADFGSDDSDDTDDSDDSDEDLPSSNENRKSSFIQTNGNMDTSAIQKEYDNSDAENEASAEEEESEASESDRRLRTLLEVKEDDAEEESHNSTLSRSRQRRRNVTQEEESSAEFPNTITLRSRQLRWKRSKGEVPEGESSDSPVVRSRPRRLRRMEEDESEEKLQESLPPRSHQRKLLQGGLSKFPGNISAIRSDEARSVQPETSQETMNTELEHTTSTPIVPRIRNGASASRSRTYSSPNQRRNDSPSFKSNVTKGKAATGKGKTKRKISPQKSPIRRPGRAAAQPKVLKEPSLTKKKRR